MALKLPQLEQVTQATRQVRPFGGMPQDRLPSLAEFTSLVRSYKPFEIYHTTPELRLNETDQSAPAAEWRWVMRSKSYNLEWAETAAYASSKNALSITRVGAGSGGDGTAQLLINQLQIGRSSTHTGTLVFAYGSTILVGATSGSADFQGRNSASLATTVAKLASATDPGGTDNPSWQFVNRPLWVEQGIEGWGAQDFHIYPNGNNVGTARRLRLLVKTTVGFQEVASGVPNAANPLFSSYAPNNAPTTTQLLASHISLAYAPAGAVTLYVNDGGVVKSLVLGSPV